MLEYSTQRVADKSWIMIRSHNDATLLNTLPYEERLALEPEWALVEGSRHFDEKSAVYATLRKITAHLNDLQVPYAVAGGMALFEHGLRRFTEDVDILVTNEGLKRIHSALTGHGYLPVFERSKNLRDTETRVRIEFLVAGQFPGDGKPKPVAFPDPVEARIDRGAMSVLKLDSLIELKLASGMTSANRIKDLADVQELIKVQDLPESFGQQLSPFVRNKYSELWHAVHAPERRYLMIWRDDSISANAQSIDDLIRDSKEAADELEAMKADGVILAPHIPVEDGKAVFVTTDPVIAKKYGMHDESEFLDEHVPE